MDEPGKHHAKWKQPDSERHLTVWLHLDDMSSIGKSKAQKAA